MRGNAGGNISELVIEKLTRTVLGWDLTRNAQPVSYAGNAPRGPVVAIADEATSSDGDMITAAFKLLGLGPVVGLRTWGGVVGMTGRHRLGDGTVITVPMNAAWFDAYGWSVENHGVAPDIECRARRWTGPRAATASSTSPCARRWSCWSSTRPRSPRTCPPVPTAPARRCLRARGERRGQETGGPGRTQKGHPRGGAPSLSRRSLGVNARVHTGSAQA